MTRYILHRLIALPFLLLGIVTLAFLLTTVTKGDPLSAILSAYWDAHYDPAVSFAIDYPA